MTMDHEGEQLHEMSGLCLGLYIIDDLTFPVSMHISCIEEKTLKFI